MGDSISKYQASQSWLWIRIRMWIAEYTGGTLMCDYDYTYHECKGLEFVLHSCKDELLFDVDYQGELLLIDLGPEYEVTVWTY